MDVIVDRCAGLDIGKKQAQACVRGPDSAGGRRSEVRTFDAFTGDLEALRDWLRSEGVTAVAMEATGPYWKPVWYVLEDAGEFDLQLVNSRHVKILPGRKTDVGDAAWLAELLEHGLLRGSFVPPEQVRRLRDLTRYRKEADPDAHGRVPADPEEPRRRRHQARLGRLRRARRVRSGDAPCPPRWRTRSRGAR